MRRLLLSRKEKANITLHKGDLPAGLDFGNSVAIDTETMGLNPIETGYVLSNYLRVMEKLISFSSIRRNIGLPT